MTIDNIHPSEMPDDILHSLGFRIKHYENGRNYWTHKQSNSKFYFHILTPDQVAIALIEIGHSEFRKKALDILSEIDIDDDEMDINN